jgi:hypothetical protein
MPYSLAAFVASTFVFISAPTDTNKHADVPAAPSVVTTCDAPTLALPGSIELEQGLQPIVKWVLEHSPRFRQQCRTLAAAPRLRATVTVSYRQLTGTSRARTAFRQTETGGLDAQIEIGSASDISELLGHEFEHLIEQLDGVDLSAMARGGEARRLTDGAFETERAIAAGQQVAGEVIDNAPDRVRKAGASMWRIIRRAVAK